MADDIIELRGAHILLCAEDGPTVATAQDALDLIGAAFAGATTVAIPTARLDPRFFDLTTGLAGEILQKFVNYRIRLVVLGDTLPWEQRSRAFRDLVREANRGASCWFLPSLSHLEEALFDTKASAATT